MLILSARAGTPPRSVVIMNFLLQYSDRQHPFRRILAVVTILALAAAVPTAPPTFSAGRLAPGERGRLCWRPPSGGRGGRDRVQLLGQAPWLGGLFGAGPGSPTAFGGWGAFGWAAASGVCGAAGLVAFYAGFAAARSAWWPRSPRWSRRVLPVGVAVAGGEHLTAPMAVGAPDLPGRHRLGQPAAAEPGKRSKCQ